MSSKSCLNETNANFTSASNMVSMKQHKSVNVDSSNSKPVTLKNAHVEKWITQNNEYWYDKGNACNNVLLDHHCFTDKPKGQDHNPLSFTATSHDNCKDLTIVNINNSVTTDCDTSTLATIKLLPAKYRQIPSGVSNNICLKCTEGTFNSPCNSKAHFTYLMWEMTSDSTKSAQLEALPVTSLRSYRELIKQNSNISNAARKNMLQVLDDFREMNNGNQSTSSVQLQRPDRDSETLDTSSIKVCHPTIQCSESDTLNGDNINNYDSALMLNPRTDCLLGTDENYQALKTHASHNDQRHITLSTAHQYDNTNYPCKNKRRHSSNSLTGVEFKEPHTDRLPRLMSDSPTCFLYEQARDAHQQPVYTCETFAQPAHLRHSSMNDLQCTHKPILKNVEFGMMSKTECNVECHPCGSSGKLKNKLTLHDSNKFEDRPISSGESNVQGICLLPPQNIEHESEADTSNSSSLHRTADSEEFSSELDEEPLTQESSSPSAESLDSNSSLRAFNCPAFPRHISERKLGREFSSTQVLHKFISSSSHSESLTHLKQPIEEHVNSSSSENGTLVLRYKRRKLDPNVYGAAVRNRFNQRQAKIPSLVEMCIQVISSTYTIPMLDQPHLCHLAEKSIDSTQFQHKNCSSNLKSNGDVDEESLPTTLHVDNSESPDTINFAKYPTGISSLLATWGGKDSSQQTFFECTSSTDGTSYSNQGSTKQRCFDNDCNQSPELNVPNVCFQYILFDIKESVALVE